MALNANIYTQQVLCRKEISYNRMSQKEREQLQAELSILSKLKHQNIVEYIERDHRKDTQDLHLYMEFCGGGDLGQVIKRLKHKNQYAEEEFVWSIFSQIVTALYRCHYGEDPPASGANVMGLGANAKPTKLKSKQAPWMVLHRDIKPENGNIHAQILATTFQLTHHSLPQRSEQCQAGRFWPIQDSTIP